MNYQDNLNIDLWPLSHDNKKYKSFQHEDGFKFSSNSNENNIFNFSSNIIQDYNNNCIKKDNPDYHIYKPLNNNFSNNNIEGNNDINYSPYGPIFSPFYSPKKMSHLLSQNLNAISPYNITFIFCLVVIIIIINTIVNIIVIIFICIISIAIFEIKYISISK